MPIIVLSEIMHLSERRRINVDFNNILNFIYYNDGFEIINFDVMILDTMLLFEGLEMHDRMIAATSHIFNCPVITKDRELQDNQLITTIW